MAEIRQYVIVGTDDEPIDSAVYETLPEARDAAPRGGDYAIVAYVFEYADSELVETSTGEEFWPPSDHSASAEGYWPREEES